MDEVDELVAFLKGCYDKDEAVARREGVAKRAILGLHEASFVKAGLNEAGVLRHIALWDPDRALREVVAGRLLLAEWERLAEARQRHERAAAEWRAAVEEEERTGHWPLPGSPDVQGHALKREDDYLNAVRMVLERLLKAHAAVYSGYPGYKQEWKP